jgi:hypothetical protein
MSSLLQRLDELEAKVSTLEQSLEEHVRATFEINSRRQLSGSYCTLEYHDDACHLTLPYEGDTLRNLEDVMPTNSTNSTNATLVEDVVPMPNLVVSGMAYIEDGLHVAANGCDTCIMFHDDVVFDDNVKFVDPVVFEDPVLFINDFTIEGMEVPSKSKTIDSDDPFYTSLDINVKEYAKVTFDQDLRFKVTSAARFKKDINVALSSSGDTSKDIPNLNVEGIITAGAFAF